MVVLNYTGEEVNAKIVYYGPGLSGKTTNLEYLYSQMPADSKGQMVSMKTRTDRTLFFDFFPLELGEICGYRTRFLLYTVPGQVYYNATRKLVLKGADAVVFVADSARDKLQENIESLRNLEDNLNEHGLSLDNIPWIIQYNKRDVPDPMPVAELHQHLNLMNVPAFEAIALTGFGVYDTFKSIAGILYKQLKEKLESGEAIGRDGESPGAGVPAVQPSTEDDVTDALDVALREVDTAAGGEVQTVKAKEAEPAVPKNLHPHPPAQTEPVAPPPPAGHTTTASKGERTVSVPPVSPAASETWEPIPRQAQAVSPEPPKSTSASAGDNQPPPVAAVTPSKPEQSAAPSTAPPRESPPDPVLQPPVDVPVQEPSQPAGSRSDTDPLTPTGPPGRESPTEATEQSFSLRSEDNGVLADVGRLVELDESSEQPEIVREEAPTGFITDPMRSTTSSDPSPEIEAEDGPVVTERKAEPQVQELTVPVVISRSQVRKTVPLRLRLEIRVVDD
jgi:signal recognition particle receptor subunit beta